MGRRAQWPYVRGSGAFAETAFERRRGRGVAIGGMYGGERGARRDLAQHHRGQAGRRDTRVEPFQRETCRIDHVVARGAHGIRKYCRPQSVTATRLAPRSELLWYPYTAIKGKLFLRVTRFLLHEEGGGRWVQHRPVPARTSPSVCAGAASSATTLMT